MTLDPSRLLRWTRLQKHVANDKCRATFWAVTQQGVPPSSLLLAHLHLLYLFGSKHLWDYCTCFGPHIWCSFGFISWNFGPLPSPQTSETLWLQSPQPYLSPAPGQACLCPHIVKVCGTGLKKFLGSTEAYWMTLILGEENRKFAWQLTVHGPTESHSSHYWLLCPVATWWGEPAYPLAFPKRFLEKSSTSGGFLVGFQNMFFSC